MSGDGRWERIVSEFSGHVPRPEGAAPLPKTHKRCKDCDKVLPLSEFYDKGAGRNGVTTRCRDCYKAHKKAKAKAKAGGGR